MKMFSRWCQGFLVAGLILAYVSCQNETTTESGEQEGRLLLTPFSSNCFVVKDECPNENITLYLYRRDRQDNPFILNETTAAQAPIDKNLPIKILIHGYTGYRDFAPSKEIRPAYFENGGDMNVISVDYGPLVMEGCYIQAVKNLPTVGKCIAKVLDATIQAGTANLRQLHVIGFSLGAHVAGFIQRNLESGKIPRLTGLDPALPLFALKEKERQLSRDDATFVDSIHTNTGLAGKILPVGDIDFYVNGGVIQPGCLANITNAISCDHNRAPAYYAESINTKTGFYGLECSDYLSYKTGLCKDGKLVVMGEKTPTSARGVYFLETNNEKPFALGKPQSKSMETPSILQKAVSLLNPASHRNRKREIKRRHRSRH